MITTCTYFLFTHILPTGRTRNRICLVTRCDMLRPLQSITYAVMMVHTNCLDKRESECSFRNTRIGGCATRRCFFAVFFFREGTICIRCSHPPVAHFLLPSSRIIRNALRNRAYFFFQGANVVARYYCVADK